MSATKVCRVMSAFSRGLRSPRPVSVGVNTVWPAARSRAATRDQHQPPCQAPCTRTKVRSEEHTTELQSLMRISYAVVCLKTNNKHTYIQTDYNMNHIKKTTT